MKWWTPQGKLMFFESLDSSGDAVPSYTVGWRIVDQADQWTQRFNGFKYGSDAQFLGGTYLMREAARELLRVRQLDGATTGLTAALSSKAIAADPDSVLYRTGAWVAQEIGVKWLPQIFTKQAHRSLHEINDGAARDSEVSGKYTAAPNQEIKTLIVIDDFITRGATLGEMKRALEDTSPDVKMIGLALGKNEKNSWATSCGRPLDNSHIPTEWDEAWVKGSKVTR